MRRVLLQSRIVGPIIVLASLSFPFAAKAAEPGQTYFDCDATPGHFSRMEVKLAPEQRRVTGSLKADMLYREGEWAPSGQIRLSDADGNRWVAIRLIAGVPSQKVVREGASVEVSIANKVDGGTPNEKRVGSLALGQILPFEISVDGDHVNVTVGGAATVIDTKLNETRKIELGCSTGDFKFIDVLAR